MMKKQHVTLSEADGAQLESRLAKGRLSARALKRATGLLALARGKTLQAVATTLGVDDNPVATWRDKYQTQGLACLAEAPRSGRPIVMDGTQRAQLTALACRSPPTEHAEWSLRLRADKVVARGYGASIGPTQVGNILKKRSQTAPEKDLGSGELNARLLARMEHLF